MSECYYNMSLDRWVQVVYLQVSDSLDIEPPIPVRGTFAYNSLASSIVNIFENLEVHEIGYDNCTKMARYAFDGWKKYFVDHEDELKDLKMEEGINRKNLEFEDVSHSDLLEFHKIADVINRYISIYKNDIFQQVESIKKFVSPFQAENDKLKLKNLQFSILKYAGIALGVGIVGCLILKKIKSVKQYTYTRYPYDQDYDNISQVRPNAYYL